MLRHPVSTWATAFNNRNKLTDDLLIFKLIKKFERKRAYSVAMPQHAPLSLPIPLNVKCSFHFIQTSANRSLLFN